MAATMAPVSGVQSVSVVDTGSQFSGPSTGPSTVVKAEVGCMTTATIMTNNCLSTANNENCESNNKHNNIIFNGGTIVGLKLLLNNKVGVTRSLYHPLFSMGRPVPQIVSSMGQLHPLDYSRQLLKW